MDINAKALELYPVKNILPKSFPSGCDINIARRELFIEGAEYVLSSLTSDSRTKEEISDTFESHFVNPDDELDFMLKSDALTAMQQYADMCVAKEREKGKFDALMDRSWNAEIMGRLGDANKENKELKQQLSEAQKEVRDSMRLRGIENDLNTKEIAELKKQLEEKDKDMKAAHNLGSNLITHLQSENQKLKEEVEKVFRTGHKKGWLRGADGHSGWENDDTKTFLSECGTTMERDTSKVGLLAEIQSLQQQISEAQKQLEEKDKELQRLDALFQAECRAFNGVNNENQKLNEEVERLKSGEEYNNLYNKGFANGYDEGIYDGRFK